ncbi:MAG: hypothetical protein H6Q69_755 [Firmicutes bacterium]|nr:hypothetical protein [Bacillota bacterium]
MSAKERKGQAEIFCTIDSRLAENTRFISALSQDVHGQQLEKTLLS